MDIEQPSEFNKPEELAEWLVWDLYQQRKIINETNKTYSAYVFNYDCNRENEYLKTIIDNKLLTLHIGCDNKTTNIDDDFQFFNILNNVFTPEEKYKFRDDKTSLIVCPYNVKFRNIIFNEIAIFNFSIFKENIDFYKCTFNQNAHFNSSTFEKDFNFSECIFNEIASFSTSRFKLKVSFYQCTFSKKTNFSEIKIENTMTFENINLNDKSYISFKDINYDKENKKFIKPSENSKIKIINTVINERIEFNNVAIKKIDFKGSDILGGGVLNRINFKADPVNWQTASFLKHEAIVRDNTIEALEYKAIEKNKHTIQLFKDILATFKNPKSLLKNAQYIPELSSLIISKLSNNHGQNWIWAVVFTLGSGLLFFNLFCFFDENNNSNFCTLFINNVKSSSFWNCYLEYLIPTKFNLLKNENNLISNIFYIIGKISIGYGIVEIVQAFRKFNTKGN